MRIALKILLWRKMVAATLLMVASADVVRKRDLFLGVDVAAETAFLMTGRASVPWRRSMLPAPTEKEKRSTPT